MLEMMLEMCFVFLVSILLHCSYIYIQTLNNKQTKRMEERTGGADLVGESNDGSLLVRSVALSKPLQPVSFNRAYSKGFTACSRVLQHSPSSWNRC